MMSSKPFDLHSWWRILSQFPLLHLFLLLQFHHSIGLTSDGVLLLSFKYSILSDPLSVFETWNYYDDTPCSWYGVTCGGAGAGGGGGGSGGLPNASSSSTADTAFRVTGISLPGVQLLGSISPDLGMIQYLQTLNLSDNSINGSLPASLFNATELEVLDLSDNLVSGELSEELIGGLRSLKLLNLSDNALAGNIPEMLSTLPNLTVVSLKNNYFSGNLPSGFNWVRVLDLSSNLINGSLPPDFGGENLQCFNVSYNRISGEIPPEFAQKIPENATLDFSFNNLTGEIPGSKVLLNQESDSFSGNPNLCGAPMENNPCSVASSPTPTPTPTPNASQPIPPPAMAAIPNAFNSSAAISPTRASSIGGSQEKKRSPSSKNGLKTGTIVEIVVGDIAGIGLLALIFLYVYRVKRRRSTTSKNAVSSVEKKEEWSNSLSSSASESKGIAKWSCLRKGGGGGGGRDDSSSEDTNSDSEERETVNAAAGIIDAQQQQKEREREQEVQKAAGLMVTVDGEEELEVETLLKASAYILGASGSSIVYKAVLEDGTTLAVRRVGEGCCVERLKDFEAQVRGVAKLVHPNLVRVRGFYWSADEKLLVCEYVPNGSLANARYRKAGSSPCHLPWEVRLKIAKGVARGLTYLHEKKHVHGNLKPNNILLDMDMEPKIGDFGLERLISSESRYKPECSTRHFGSKRSTTSRDSFQDLIIGATPSPTSSSIGCVSPYHPPESLRSLKPNSRWDVYSFGVVFLELVTGKVLSPDDLGHGLGGLTIEDKVRVLRMADVAIRAEMEDKEEILLTCLKLGYNCASPAPQKRPSMKEVLQVLEKVPTSPPLYFYGP